MAFNKTKSQPWLPIRITGGRVTCLEQSPQCLGFQTSVSVLKHPWKTLLCSQDKNPLSKGYQWLFHRGARTGMGNNK